MRSVYDEVRSAFNQAFTTVSSALNGQTTDIALPKDTSFGDFQCNSAMKFAKQLGVAPKILAEQVVVHIRERKDLFSQASVAGPGFINVTLADPYVIHRLSSFNDIPLIYPAEKKERIIVDFSSPNIAKEMHVGHLRSTIIGDAIARILEAKGHDVVRQNHVGDWGTSFGMLIAHIQSDPIINEKITSCSLADLMTLYRTAKVRFDEDPSFKKQAQMAVIELQKGNPTSHFIWRAICDTSRRAFDEIYRLLHVSLQERGESFYNPWLETIVKTLEERGIVELSDGAKCIFVEGVSDKDHSTLPLIIQKSDGGFNYDTTDITALWHRVHIEKASRIIYVTDSGQALHFQLVFGAGKKANLYDADQVRLDHVGFGVVLAPDGKKFKTRSGQTERLADLLEAAVTKAQAIIRERNPTWSTEEINSLAHTLGIGAVKYSDLSCNRMSDYTFSYERMLRFEGNTAAFIMYSFVRAKSILAKLKNDSVGPLIQLNHAAEQTLAKQLMLFNDVLSFVEKDLLPHRLTDYLYTLSETFNQFFRDCRVEGDPREKERAFLVSLTMKTLQKGLELLGIPMPEKM